MSLIFAGLVPHPPSSLSTIDQEAEKKLQKTIKAFKTIKENLYISAPELIIIISPHGQIEKNFFSLNNSPNLETDLSKFGDYENNQTWTGDYITASLIDTYCQNLNLPTILTADKKLDYGSAIPLLFVAQQLKNIKILPIYISSGLDNFKHFEFGQKIQNLIQQTTKRIAVLASADLAHTLNNNSPLGFKKNAQIFDKKIIESLENKNTTAILNLDQKIVNDAFSCGYKPLLILLGLLHKINCEFKNLAYENPFGIGYLSGYFNF